jgi:hypothetical protein
LSSTIRRGAKSAALGLVTSRVSPEPDALSAAALRMMKMGLDPGLRGGYEGGAKGACCISVDFDVTRQERFPWNRAGTKSLLELSEKHGIPLTWAICGKTAEEDQQSYHAILNSPVKQEIGVHTYSHIYADECTEEAYEEDIERCVSVLGLASQPRTFVFPKNREGRFGLLKRLGFTSYRGALRAIGSPVENEGLWNIRPVYYVDQKSLHASDLMKKFVDACIARSAVFHLWTHPWCLAIDGDTGAMSSEALEPVFEYLERKGREGTLSLTTMGGLSAFLTHRASNKRETVSA